MNCDEYTEEIEYYKAQKIEHDKAQEIEYYKGLKESLKEGEVTGTCAMKYRLDRTWQKSDTIEVKANTLEEAVEKAYDAPLTVGDYLDDSLIVHTDYYEEEPNDDTSSS